jgi:hypothetical protein
MQKNTARPLAIGLIVLGALIRVTQHWNFAPVGAMSLFAGARLRGWKAYLLPLALMAITDPLLGGYSVATPLVYASFLINVWIGSRLRDSENPVLIGSAALAGSIQFFLITNFAWLTGSNMYPHTIGGMLSCYAAGIPFFWRTLASDVFYSGVLFGLHAWLSRTVVRSERIGQPRNQAVAAA